MNKDIMVINDLGIKIILVGEVEKVTSTIIESLKRLDPIICWNDSSCQHYIIDFKIENLWFESLTINNELTEIEFNVFD